MSETRVPTHGLRFIEREVPMPSPYAGMSSTVRVLQQMFTDTAGRQFWEDVPLITESKGGDS